MKQEELRELLEKIINKGLDLDKTAKLLWSLRYYHECKDEYAAAQKAGEDQDNISFRFQNMERARLQLNNYMTYLS